MSIKSQKSLNEECSEIFERSYSVRSVSDESLSSDDDDEALAKELMNKLTPAVLSKLRRCFKKNKERNNIKDFDRKVLEVMRAAAAEEGIEFAPSSSSTTVNEVDSLWLDEGGFVNAMNNIFGHHKYSPHSSRLFRVLDPFSKGRVSWRQLVARLVMNGNRRTCSRRDQWKEIEETTCTRLKHCKRETIVKLVNIEEKQYFCYVAVSKGGRIGVYSGDMRLLHTYEIYYHRSGIRRRVKNSWITDAVYLSDVQYLVYSASDRSLTIYDATTISHTPIICITGLPNIPTCLAYTPSAAPSLSSELALGSERGDVIRVHFHQPRVQFMHVKNPEAINYYFWMELSSPPHTSYLTITTWRRVHSRNINRLVYISDGDILLSCSHDNEVSMRLRHVPGKLDDYIFKVLRGISCFHAIPPLRLIATGGRDGSVRLWERTQPHPFAVLQSPATPHVLDVAVIPQKEIVVAYCSNCVLHIWDMYEECLLQSIKLNFPFLGVLGKKVEFGAFCVHPGPVRKAQVVDEPVEMMRSSRRGSSVYQGSTGGLMLMPDSGSDHKGAFDDDPEYSRFNRSELIITCCDYICLVNLNGSFDRTRVMSPPGDTLKPRRPSVWDLPDLSVIGTPMSRPSQSPSTTSQYLAPISAEYSLHDLDALLQNAGLQGILEKDFVLMQGLKYDLNNKLAQMEANKATLTGAVNVGAPYLALKTYEPEPLSPVDEMTEDYKRIMKLFPGPSVSASLAGSQGSTPRRKRSHNL